MIIFHKFVPLFVLPSENIKEDHRHMLYYYQLCISYADQVMFKQIKVGMHYILILNWVDSTFYLKCSTVSKRPDIVFNIV